MRAATGGREPLTASEKRKRRAQRIQKATDPVVQMALCVRPLLALFAVVNDVFEEDDAFDPARMQNGYGRIYREWKKCREAMDPGYRERRS